MVKKTRAKKKNKKVVTVSLRIEQEHLDAFDATVAEMGLGSRSAFFRMAGLDYVARRNTAKTGIK